MLMKALGKTRWIIESLGEMLQYCNSRMGAYIEILPGSSTGSKGVGCFASISMKYLFRLRKVRLVFRVELET